MAWREDPSVGAVILTGAGPAFSAGFERFDALFASSELILRDRSGKAP
jgi:enoyl-CoA hydratase/carnithine racemase